MKRKRAGAQSKMVHKRREEGSSREQGMTREVEGWETAQVYDGK